MRANGFVLAMCGCVTALSAPQAQSASTEDPGKVLVGRLDLEKYKATIKGLTQFGDRQQGTDRNRAAVDWIEAQLKSYGCATERIKYTYDAPGPQPPAEHRGGARAAKSPAGKSARAWAVRGCAA